MFKYHKINTVFNRDLKGKIIEGSWSQDEFEFLQNCDWELTEKVDGTNVRVCWDGRSIEIGGRTDNAQMPIFLLNKLQEVFKTEVFESVFNNKKEGEAMLFGEGYGARIQKAGGNYNPDGVDFILFDVFINGYWLTRHDVDMLANMLGLKSVPVLGCCNIKAAIDIVKSIPKSTWGCFPMEGIVMRPKIELKSRNGNRIIAKLKCRDFKKEEI